MPGIETASGAKHHVTEYRLGGWQSEACKENVRAEEGASGVTRVTVCQYRAAWSTAYHILASDFRWQPYVHAFQSPRQTLIFIHRESSKQDG